ncbi:molybdopterin-containing oxidoreductase family protein [Novosphingobium album (ex Liu et al. 2023)]|uniref:Molybdopterin-dependent oxidoreductase n=1 Tax=Novosphingobium album (ex Liu et al. 2023) TaxID=3031130 RepID=A0ABT5WJ92_9SPHN|nr:molybdopterin-dependent oxidoreductase [Novosphingobium album (ex Liu et al. 2023)]MDE8650117.1 molybdopterin-dependent oxidoreductase [Novosphingobium album (ex Liu et al. 2023)]
MATQPIETKRTYCKICTTQCGIVVELQGETVLKVRGDKTHPLTKGYTCPKGRSVGENHHHPDAISHPMMRQDGALAVVSWEEALDDIAARLGKVLAEHGPGAIGVFFGSGLGMDSSGFRMAEAFHNALGQNAQGGAPKFSPLTIDGTAKVLVSSTVGGFPGLNPKTDYDNVEMLLYVGTNPMVSHGHNTGMYNPAGPLRAAAARGRVWTIDPLFTETAKFSTRHIAPLPGKDYAILAWLTREVIDAGLPDLPQPVQGLETLRAALEPFTRARAAAIASVSEEDLADLLADIRKADKLVVETGTGVTMSNSANLTHWFSWTLMILTGAMNRKGGAWFHPGFLTCFDSFELPVLDNPFTPGPPTMPEVSGLIGDWPCAALPGEIAAGNIRAMVNFGGSLLRSFPDANRLAPALEQLDTLVTFEVVENETTALSSHVLPTKDQLERPEVAMWDTLGFRVAMQHSQAVLPATGERRAGWWVISQLMRRMGMEVPAHVPEDDRRQGADEAMLAAHFGPGARATYEEVAAKSYVEKPLEFPAAWVDTHIEKMGGWKLAPDNLIGFLAEVLAQDEAALGQPRPLCFISRRQRRKLNASLDFLGAPADIILNPADAGRHGVVHGEPVRVETERGTITLTANVSETIRPGVASIPHGHGVANVNLLTDASKVDAMTGMVLYTGIPIALEPVGA